MPQYYLNINVQPGTRDNEVHRTDERNCPNPALPHNRVDLDWHASCQSAVQKAKSDIDELMAVVGVHLRATLKPFAD